MNEFSTLTEHIGQNLQQVRVARGLSLDKLAALSDVSKGMLIRIEQARTNPSVGTLCKIANALSVPITSFLDSNGEPDVRIIDPSEATPLWTGDSGGFGRIVAGSETPSVTEFWLWSLFPGEKHSGLAHPSGTREFLYVQEGTLTLRINSASHEASPGQTLVFTADVPHQYANLGDKELKLQMVICEPK